MGDPSYFLAVVKDFVLNWDRLSAHKRQAILKLLHERYRWESADELPRTFEELMKCFDKCKFYGYIDLQLLAMLTAFPSIFPEIGCAVFVAYNHPVVCIFNPLSRDRDRKSTRLNSSH